MDARYWEGIGDRYELEILDSSRADARRVIRTRLREFADERAVAWDFGCGVGHYLELLASHFRSVHAVDFAEALLVQARARAARLDHVSVHRADLGAGRLRLPGPKARLALCANVLISEQPAQRKAILHNIRRHMLGGGVLLLVVPSLESALYSNQRLVEWNRRLGCEESEALASGFPLSRAGARDLVQGIVRIERVPTKHFLREELMLLLRDEGFRVLGVDKVEYDWETEFEDPPRWMGRPGPWDWLCVARARRPR